MTGTFCARRHLVVAYVACSWLAFHAPHLVSRLETAVADIRDAILIQYNKRRQQL